VNYLTTAGERVIEPVAMAQEKHTRFQKSPQKIRGHNNVLLGI
jgi:hypothetical protein